MPRTAIVHLGLPKTGTTTIQRALFKERTRLLSECGILVPALADNLTDHLCPMFLDDPREHISVRLSGVSTSEAAEEYRRACVSALEASFAEPGWSTILLTAEGLSNLPA